MTYWHKGDEFADTGKREHLHGADWMICARITDGKIAYIMCSEDEARFEAEKAAQYKIEQSGFARLHKSNNQ